jgi:adenylate cyclase
MIDDFADSTGWVEHYESGLALYRSRDFTGAILDFEKVLAVRNQDQASSMMIGRCKEQLEAPTGDDWDDTTIALRK